MGEARPQPAPPRHEADADARTCPACGEGVGRHDERCRHCGEDLVEGAERPWEGPYRRPLRRDSEPHRGTLVLVLGLISLVIGALAMPALLCCFPLAILAPVGLALGIPAWVMARRDLKLMDTGMMDPAGRGTTQGGQVCAIIGTILDALGTVAAVAFIAFYAVILAGIGRVPTPRPPPAPVAPPPGKVPAEGAVRRLSDYLPRLAARRGVQTP
jgi:hypothetical protein